MTFQFDKYMREKKTYLDQHLGNNTYWVLSTCTCTVPVPVVVTWGAFRYCWKLENPTITVLDYGLCCMVQEKWFLKIKNYFFIFHLMFYRAPPAGPTALNNHQVYSTLYLSRFNSRFTFVCFPHVHTVPGQVFLNTTSTTVREVLHLV